VIKISPYNNRPAEIHYTAVKHIFRFLRNTIEDGLYYWRQNLHIDLKTGIEPELHPDNHDVQIQGSDQTHAYGTVDANWAADKSHSCSVSGIAIFLAGAPVIFRSRFQPTVLHSSTENEFIAASDAGKLTLYL
jgi:hypothetical protein